VRALALALLLVSAALHAEEGVEVKKSRFLLLPAAIVERAAGDQYAQLIRAATQKGVLNNERRSVERVRNIARALIPQAARFNPAASRWRWEVNVIRSASINAFCMPGGKIAVFSGLMEKLQLTDDELAVVLGHEMAHALLEHGRARASEQVAKNLGISLAAAVFNLSNISASLLAQATDLAVTLPHSRGHESDADLAGMELAARAGYDPRAALALWKKMERVSRQGQPAQFLSTHPSHANRVRDIEGALPRVLPLYAQAKKSG
jgi:predicted Zn-dependent protease